MINVDILDALKFLAAFVVLATWLALPVAAIYFASKPEQIPFKHGAP